jgi:hypothetical protein
MSKTLQSPTIPQAEIDQRSRESRRRLENVEARLVPGIRATRSWVNQRLYPFLKRHPAPCWAATSRL